MSEILTMEEAAERLKISLPTLRGMIRSGDLEAFKAGRQWRIKDSAIQDLPARQQKREELRDKEGVPV